MTALDALLPRPVTDWPAELGSHLSYSSIHQFLTCPEQFRLERVLGHEREMHDWMVWGRADHEAIEACHHHMLEHGECMPVMEVVSVFQSAFFRIVSEAGGWQQVRWGKRDMSESLECGARMVSAYHREVCHQVRPREPEQVFTLAVPGCPVPLTGRIDLITEDGVILDRKTASAKPSGVGPEWRLQGRIYQLHECLPVVWHVSTKTKVPAVYTPAEIPGLVLMPDDSEMLRTQRLVASVARSMVAMYKEFGPRNPWPGSVSVSGACAKCPVWGSCDWTGEIREDWA